MITTNVPAFHSQIRDSTSDLHAMLDQLPISKKIVSADVTLEVYADYLQRLYRVHRSLEKNIFPLLTGLFTDLALRKKSDLILNDLQSLNFTALAGSESLFEDSVSPSFAVGMCYVTEGSTLGSRFILKNIVQSLHLSAHVACKFLNGYGDTTGAMWKKFIDRMTSYADGVDMTEQSRIIDGARFAFEQIHAELAHSSKSA